MIVEKALRNVGTNINDKLKLINEHTIEPLKEEDVFTFDVVLCDNEIDRVGDKMTHKFLEQFAEKSKSLVGIKDHEWIADNQMARLYDTELVDTDEDTSIGEKRTYVLGHAYCLRSNEDYVKKVNAGLLNHCSVSFISSGDTCSVCGCATHKMEDDRAICENGHIAGKDYDGVTCYNVVDNCDDALEWSLVAVPCQKKAGIKNKILGGISMKKSAFIMQRILKSKAMPEELKDELEAVAACDSEEEINEDDVNSLIAENESLKAEIESLKAEIETLKGEAVTAKVCGAVEKAVEQLEPINEQVRADMIEKIDKSLVAFGDDGKVTGLDEQVEKVKAMYKGLLKSDVVAREPEKKEATEVKKCFNPSFGTGKKANVVKKSFHEACGSLN